MTDLRDNLRTLVAELESLALDRRQRCRTANAEGNKEMDAYHDGYAMAYADCKLRLDAILARNDRTVDIVLEREKYESIQHHRPRSTPPMTREALEEAEWQQEKKQ